MKKLIYFTDSYPFSDEYTWKKAEIVEASKVFSEVVIIPFTYKNSNTSKFPSNVKVEQPTLGSTLYAKPKHLKYFISIGWNPSWVTEFVRAIPHGKKAIISWYLASVYAKIISKKPSITKLKKSNSQSSNTVLFFQWTMNNALLIPLFKKWGYQNIICRMHGYDLYEFRHQNYLPYKKQILKSASICTFISLHGKNYANDLYPFTKKKSFIHYLGAQSLEKNTVQPNQTFHIISISRVVPLKRTDWIAKALEKIDTPIVWTHIGSGESFKDLEQSVNELRGENPKTQVHLLGWLTPNEIREYFQQNAINALVLVSETEGLPLVIMEAFSASIPVIATDVGGVAELVNDKNGYLLPTNSSVSDISSAILQLATETYEAHQLKRNYAYKSYLKGFNLNKNSIHFIQFLAQQCN